MILMRTAFPLASILSLSVSFVASISLAPGILSQQCVHETLLLYANLACPQTGTGVDLVQPILGTVSHGNSNAPNYFTPWSYMPVCTQILEGIGSELCVYTNNTFSHGRGISIFTTPRIAEEFAALLPFQDSTSLHGINNPEGPWYTQKLPGRGVGMLAERDLERGDLITAYTPVLLGHMENLLSTQEREKFLRLAVNQLPAATVESYFSLATIYGDPRVIVQDVVKANAFEMQVGGKMHLALFPEPSRMNHDCSPNAQYYLDPSLLTHYVHATRAISQDEEITISYSYPFNAHSIRQQQLLDTFHFTCSCSRCLEGDSSDVILSEINSLQQILGDWNPESEATPKKAKKLIQLYEEEGLEGFLDTAYGYAALTYNAVGDIRGAKKYAGMAADAIALREGPGAPDFRAWKEMIENPEGHWSWRRRNLGR